MNKIIVTLAVLLVTSISYSQKKKDTIDEVQKAYLKNNKKAIDKASPMINFFLKYQDSSKTVTQGDFNKLMSIYGVKKDKKQALSEQDAFSIVDGYIKTSEGKKKKPEKEEIDETGNDDTLKSEEEKKKKELEEQLPGQIKSIIGGISYEDFKKLMLMQNPNATESEIRKEYEKFQKSSQKL